MKTLRRSLAATHSLSFALLIILPVFASALWFGVLLRDELITQSRNQLEAGLEQTAQNIYDEMQSAALIGSALAHDRRFLEASLAYSGALSADDSYRASQELDIYFDRLFLLSRFIDSFFIAFENDKNYFVSRNYPLYGFNETFFKELESPTPHAGGKIDYADALFAQGSGRPAAALVVYPPEGWGYHSDIRRFFIVYELFSAFNFLESSFADEKYIVGKDGLILFASDSGTIGRRYADIRDGLRASRLVFEQRIPESGWLIAGLVERSFITRKATENFLMLLLLLLLITLFFLYYNRIFFLSVLRPLRVLTEQMSLVSRGNFSARVEKNPYHELNTLADTFNSMVDRLAMLTEAVKSERDEKLRTEIQALRFQLNPHFLCNTLNSIRLMAGIAKNDSLKKVTTALMHIMQDNLRGDTAVFSLEHELLNLEDYVYIMKIRFGNSFDFYTEIPSELKARRVPSLILQPLVENSILHGIRGIGWRGTIIVSAHLTDNDKTLLLEVRDNGTGMDEQTLLSALEGRTQSARGVNHIGIYNVRRRIRLSFGPPYTLEISSFPLAGTVATISLPANLEEKP